MIRTLDADSALLTTSRRPVWSPSSAPCPWGWMKGGTRSSLTCPTSLVARTAPTISRPCACKFTQTAELEEFTSPTAYTLRTSFLLNSSSSCLSLARLRLENHRSYDDWWQLSTKVEVLSINLNGTLNAKRWEHYFNASLFRYKAS